MVDQTLSCTFAGSLQSITPRLRDFIARHEPDELLVALPIHDHALRRHALELTAAMQATLSSGLHVSP